MPRKNHGPYLSKQPNRHGEWEVRWTEEGGRSRRISTGKTSRQAATIWMAGWLGVHEQAKTESAAPLRVSELFELYDAEWAAEHVRDLERIGHAKKPLLAFFGAMRPPEIDAGTITTYCTKRRRGEIGRPVSDGTIRRELEHLRAVLLYAVRIRKRTHVSADDVLLITMPEKAEARHVVATEAELDRIMQRAQPPAAARLTRLYRFTAIARYTAGRKEAIETLPWSRVDLDGGMIDFRVPGRKRTSKRRVPIPIADELMPILRRAFAERQGLWVLDQTTTISKEFRRATAALGLDHITPHVLRHTWATRKAEDGVSAFAIATFLGDTMETVEANYMHRSPDYLRKAFAAVRQPEIVAEPCAQKSA